MASYWSARLQSRISRRRALAAGATLGVGALALSVVDCGKSSDSGKSLGIASNPVDTTKQAVKGGTMQSFMPSEGVNFDATTGTAQVNAHADLAYSRLVKSKLGTFANPPDGSVEGDAAESWEFSPDGMQVTLKLRSNLKLDPRAPTNGRAMNATDIKFSWDRFAALNPARGNWLSSIVPDAPIDRFEFPDNNTVVVKLSQQFGSILNLFAGGNTLYAVPAEADGKFDIKQEMRGSGPWMMTKYQPSNSWEYQRNPNWYGATDRPFLDGMNYALMSEATVQAAQFRAKRLWWLTPDGDQVAAIKRESPGVIVSPTNPIGSGVTGGYTITISKLQNSPFQQDVRLRYALSMLVDRDAWIDTFFNVSGLKSEGLPLETAWNSHISCGATEWLDPKSGKLGEDSKWFQHNPDEAAKLLRAAGKFGMDTEFSYATSGFTTPLTANQSQVFAQMWQQGGHFKLKINGGDYNAWYQPTYLRGRAQWEGIAWTPGGTPGSDVDIALWGWYAPGARNDGIYAWDRVPGLEEAMKRQRRETDDKKRVAATQDLQRLLAKQMPSFPFPGLASTFNLYWPWMGNAGVYRYRGSNVAAHYSTLTNTWYDKAKASA